jgi:hypothetical protein
MKTVRETMVRSHLASRMKTYMDDSRESVLTSSVKVEYFLFQSSLVRLFLFLKIRQPIMIGTPTAAPMQTKLNMAPNMSPEKVVLS